MPDLSTREQAREYLAQIYPDDREWRIYEIPDGWVCQPVLSREQIEVGQGLGLTNLVIDTDTAVVIEYPSWSTEMVAEDYANSRQTGQPPSGGQIYPPLWHLNIQRTQETSETIEYQVQVESRATPPEESAEYQLRIDKSTLMYPSGLPMAGEVVAWAESRSRQDGTWPDQGTREI